MTRYVRKAGILRHTASFARLLATHAQWQQSDFDIVAAYYRSYLIHYL
jgi:hypothetical protein